MTLLLAIPTPVRADAAMDAIYRQVDRQQLDDALGAVNALLKSRPSDVEARFLKGVILTRQGNFTGAIKQFHDLTVERPDLPEPYNNLAVLYANQGMFDLARESLLKAIKTHPSYATAHQNLRDIYGKLAAQAYSRALKMETPQSDSAKLALVTKPNTLREQGERAQPSPEMLAQKEEMRRIQEEAQKLQDEANAAKEALTAAQTRMREESRKRAEAESRMEDLLTRATQAETELAKQQKQLAKETLKQQQAAQLRKQLEQERQARLEAEAQARAEQIKRAQLAAAAPARPLQPPPPPPQVEEPAAPEKHTVAPPMTRREEAQETQAAPVRVMAAAPTQDAPAHPPQDDEASAAVHNWAKAWARKDVETYLNSYGENFRPSRGRSRATWEKTRRNRLSKPGKISVEVSDLEISDAPNGRKRATFVQTYRSYNYRDQVKKLLLLEKQDEQWKIVRELSGG
ncbi:hypothetical protein MAIT1_02489 [Magnetofaba australis IT-1]|uniref:Cds6 C-terminal domain-containing protein n=2 Tax=Magnetofaba TaxID=1472292 RepID=A0A1Y2K3Y1_9PROT|nr:hypothetical protein MAIT1_02489 [Magnetofaba australis IT-1]